MYTVLFVIAAYLLGSISFALVSSRLFGLADPRTYGSKNPGATNVLRSGNKLAALLTLSAMPPRAGWRSGWLFFTAGNFRWDRPELPVSVSLSFWDIFFRFLPDSGEEKVWRRLWVFCWVSVRCSDWRCWQPGYVSRC